MKIALAADHAAFEFKRALTEELRSLGHEVTDFGTGSPASCDYPDFATPAAQSVADGICDRNLHDTDDWAVIAAYGLERSILQVRTPRGRR